jgi:hypothetical protein
MEAQSRERLIHSYDTERHQVLCGLTEQTNSTKHAAAVTCVTCRELLRRAPLAARAAGPAARVH